MLSPPEENTRRRSALIGNKFTYSRLSKSNLADVRPHYNVVVIGSGYGGSIAASRAARAGRSVCVLERGKELQPGEYPDTLSEASKETQIEINTGNSALDGKHGDPTDLVNVIINKELSVVQGCGLGGGSLINANVGLDCDPRVFEDKVWPEAFRNDLEAVNGVDREHAWQMLKPTPYPHNYPPLPKMGQMEKAAKAIAKEVHDIEDLDKVFYRPPLYVNFEETDSNHVGVPQAACNGCGNCCSGCNYGAKNTLIMNYLPDAKNHGAEIFTHVEVKAVEKCAEGWRVVYVSHIQTEFHEEERFIRADIVILGAGALGSTKILHNSKKRGLDLSDQLGERFSTNGDTISFSYNGREEARAVGLPPDFDRLKPTGPSITGIIDLRLPGRDLSQGYVIEDGAPPHVTRLAYSILMSVESSLSGIDNFPEKNLWEGIAKDLQPHKMSRTLCMLTMSQDKAKGRLVLDKKGSIVMEYPDVGEEKNFDLVNEGHQVAAKSLESTFVPNPVWGGIMARSRDVKSLITVHPLGGCPMGESGKTGVVNHKGQVFKGNMYTDVVHDGLYVTDGAIIPRSLGVNPTLTICTVAERCMRLMAKDHGWTIDYSFDKKHDTEITELKPGFRFTERMVGSVDYSNNGAKAVAPCEFILTIQSDDLEGMLNEEAHSAEIFGTVTCTALHKDPLTVSDGVFQLFSKDQNMVDTKEMLYKMVLNAKDGQQFYFHGRKEVHRDHAGEIGLGDTTTLFIKIYRGTSEEGKTFAEGVLKIQVRDFMDQLSTLEVLNVDGKLARLKWMSKFFGFFAKSLWKIYGPTMGDNSHEQVFRDPQGKRPLRLGGAKREIYPFLTEDNLELRLTRYRAGSKGPVMLSHGMGVSSGIYTLDTVDTNLLEYLAARKYDVWLLDWRASCDLPATCFTQFTMDDAARYDIPAAVDKIIEVTGSRDVQAVVHCVGSVTFFASLLMGKLQGKIRNVVVSQVAAHPIVTKRVRRFAAMAKLPRMLKAFGMEGISARLDPNGGCKDAMRTFGCKVFNLMELKSTERCKSEVCRRISFMYGLLYQHENLNAATHDTLHEFFGYGNITAFIHLTKILSEECLLDSTGGDTYLPDHKQVNPETSDAYMEKMKLLDIPICFIVGQKNMTFQPKATQTTFDRCCSANPNQEYAYVIIPDYGHIDCIIGCNAARDVYPHFLEALEEHAIPAPCAN
ncbi:LIPK [Branchiostoma lanceolatum]|uniref:Cholesterol oxidase n=1 Tax=Branchiostoma lanceolatum TaxID=7740 RepID=A0A8K0ABW1_BRALA|nr:LIPK [Branchiostoma lanceolatum]